MEYSYLLDQADESEDPYMRLVYASELFSLYNFFFPQSNWKFSQGYSSR